MIPPIQKIPLIPKSPENKKIIPKILKIPQITKISKKIPGILPIDQIPMRDSHTLKGPPGL